MSEKQQPPVTTTDSGIPVTSDENSLTVGPNGPTVLHGGHLVQKMQPFNREGVPERVVHAKGSGAHGFFEVTEDVTQWTNAAFLSEVGKRTPMFARFSQVAGELGSADTVRDPRGFALKFYTEEGNYDLVGNNTPTFFVRDAIKFEDFIRSQKRMPDTGLRSNDAQWDFWTLSPETAHQVAILMSDRGTPRSYRCMNGYSTHTYSWMNAAGERFWVKYHFKTVQGIENFNLAEANAMVAEDIDFLRRDLWDAIAAGDAPEWRLELQIMPFEEAAEYRFTPFDLTKVWPHADSPPITIGRMVLDRNPENHFAEVDQAGFAPARLVPGIGLSPDKMLMGRVFSYHDTHLHRIGANYEQLPINAPRSAVHSYSRDRAMTYHHPGSQPVYSPNSYGGPQPDPSKELPNWWVEAGEIGRYAYEAHADDDDFVQPRALYRDVMSETDREHLATNIIAHASDGVSAPMQARVVEYWSNIDPTLGARVAAGLHVNGSVPSGNGGAPHPTQVAAEQR